MLKLFYTPGTCARASHIALRDAGAEFELQRVDFATAEQRTDAYRKINPKGRVPALQTDRGVLTETPAILAYIAQIHPEARLAPLDDPFEFARLQSFNNYLCATVHVAHAHSPRGARWADDPAAIAELKRKAPEVVADCFRMIEEEFFTGPWTLGANYSIADPYLFTITQWLPSHRIDSADYPQVHAHHQRMLEREAVRATLAAEAAS
ncbi:MAG: glutathione S-transferase N-terminal domain-containing protein [Pseudomonadales bacterium]|nr:glutathione S-transferase N-terminal domain-containing protein [Pseudomonadales bacterium]